jgi:carboxylate-amine ligase
VAKKTAEFDDGENLCVLNSNQVEENFWRAIRYGLDGSLIDFETRSEVPAPEAIEKLMDDTEGFHASLGLEPHMDRLADMLDRGNGAQRQIRLYRSSSDIAAVHRAVVEWAQPHNWTPAGDDQEQT